MSDAGNEQLEPQPVTLLERSDAYAPRPSVPILDYPIDRFHRRVLSWRIDVRNA
jgi:hypothetical protein